LRFQDRTLLLVAVAVSLLQATRSESQLTTRIPSLPPPAEAVPADTTCAVYSLSDLGDDPSVGLWVADTLLKLMDSGAWRGEGSGRWLLNYHPQSRVLVVHHTPVVQAKIESFLRDVKKALPQSARSGPEMQVIQAGGTAPAVVRPSGPAAPAYLSGPPAYIVPGPKQQPKHLFHFIIRYEGDGLGEAGPVDDDKTSPGKSPVVAESAGQAMCRSLAEMAGVPFASRATAPLSLPPAALAPMPLVNDPGIPLAPTTSRTSSFNFPTAIRQMPDAE
jgi:hypothetical protein